MDRNVLGRASVPGIGSVSGPSAGVSAEQHLKASVTAKCEAKGNVSFIVARGLPLPNRLLHRK